MAVASVVVAQVWLVAVRRFPGVGVYEVVDPDLGFDPLADFAPVALLGNQPFVVAVHPGVPARSLAELVAYGGAIGLCVV